MSKFDDNRTPFFIWTVEANRITVFLHDHLDENPINIRAESSLLGIRLDSYTGSCAALNNSLILGSRNLHLATVIGSNIETFDYVGIDTEKGFYNVLKYIESTTFILAAITEPLDILDPAKYFYRL
jgi:hypothetical protein